MSGKIFIEAHKWNSFINMKVLIKRENWFIPEGGKKPIIICPKCGGGLLGDAAPHGIKANGDVYASVVCEHESYKCNFHSYVTLEGWNGGDIPHS
jgi:hypothetical protein